VLGTALLASCGGDSGAGNTSAQILGNTSGTPISVAMSATYAGLTTTQKASFAAVTNDPAGVTWSITPGAGLFDQKVSHSGELVSLTAANTPGVYTVTATSLTDGTKSASTTVAVTDLPGVYTYHNDAARDGANDREYLLTPANVNSARFGKLFSCVTDGAIYTQPLWAANLEIGGAKHNAVFVATQHDGLFAFDADANPCVQLWSANLIDAAHGATAGESTVPSGGPGYLVGNGAGSITPETGVTGTPVIDPATATLYVVSKSMEPGGAFHHRLHAIDMLSGAERSGSPVTISASYPGTFEGGSTVSFNDRQQLQRAGLALVNGTVYVAFAAHEDTRPYYGWVMGYRYDGSAFTRTAVFNVTPNAGEGGVWMSGGAPAADQAGNLYLLTGNGTFDASTPGPLANNDYGDSLLQLSGSLAVLQYFTPSDQALGVSEDQDFGSGGAAVLVNLPAGSPVAHLITGGGKDGNLYVLNPDALGGYGDAGAWQELAIGGPIYSTPAFWNNNLYIAGVYAPVIAYQLDPATALFSQASSAGLSGSGYYGRTPSVSAAGATNGIVWALNSKEVCNINMLSGTPYHTTCGPAVLEAYDASNLGNLLWSSATVAADSAGNSVRNAVPTIANGKVYIGTRGNNAGGGYGSTTASGQLDVYGLR
jgi:hypothetical protein